MGIFIIAAVVAVGAYVLLTKPSALQQLQAQTGINPNPNVGAIVVGGQPYNPGYNPAGGYANTERTAAGFASQGIGVTAQVGSQSFAAAGTAAGTAIPFVGAAIGIATSVISMIAAHHQAALANEGKVLNATEPTTFNALALVAQAAIRGEITSVAQAKKYTDQIVSDYYLQVKTIQRGTWHYTLTPAQDPSVLGPDTSAGDLNWFGANISGDTRPDPCNAACVIGHYGVERNATIVLLTVQNILAGKHGVMMFPAIPAHATQNGFPAITMAY